jgi:KaiC/GvpD/RAD55 family RecA-like ATPase
VVFGGGIVRDSTNLLGGQPGAGKSTLTLQIANVIAGMVDDEQDENELGKIYARTLYISAEEKLGAIGARAVRLQLPNRGRIMMVDALKKQEDDEGEEIEFDVDTIENHVVDIQPRLFIVDSLAELANGFAAQVVFCKRLKEIATENNCPALIIQHVNKKKDMAGLMALQHKVDALLLFSLDKKGLSANDKCDDYFSNDSSDEDEDDAASNNSHDSAAAVDSAAAPSDTSGTKICVGGARWKHSLDIKSVEDMLDLPGLMVETKKTL